MTSNRELPPKESAVFRNLLKNYELRQYKKGLKMADSILKKYPNHGETLAMKGIFLNNLEKKTEGYEYVKQGVRNDLTSHICWHVYGLMHRADKNYAEAAKCYTQALKYNKNDVNILRDFALLQTQLRQYDAAVEARAQLLQHRPTNPPFWIGLAVSYQMAGKPEKALAVLKSQEEAIKDTPVNYEQSELRMYHNWLLEETGDYEGALEHLKSIETKVMDKRSIKEKRAHYLTKLGKVEEAESAYRLLISENPYDGRYISRLLELKGFDKDDKKSEANQLLADLLAQYPKSKAIEDLSLHYAEDDSFKIKAQASIQNALRKGVPSLFASMKKYYADEKKQKVIADLVESYSVSLEKFESFEEKGAKEPPTALLWCLYYLAQHYDYHRQLDKALSIINKAIEHSPTVVELYMTKGRILKHSGKPQEAADVMNDARELDLQDRFINSKCAKYMLRADRVEEAEKTIGLFTRREVDPIQDMTDMQCQWFMTEEGYSFMRQKKYGKALKRFQAVVKFYDDYFEDQFDFHAYCLGKSTLRAYVDMLRSSDRMRGHPYYVKAAKGAVAVYMILADIPKEISSLDEANMTEAEKKKAKSKARKAELKASKENKENQDPTTATVIESTTADDKDQHTKEEQHTKKESKKKVDTDPEGETYLKSTTPLDDAYKLVEPLLQLNPEDADIQLLVYDIYIRQEKWLLAIKTLNNVVKLNKKHPDLKSKIEQCKKAVASPVTPIDPRLQTLIDSQLNKLVV
ncbi:NMDA receptor-regulated protein 1-domain-containing protein [Halteromyces radiatus]|uniref:NMDA receptor-regulated protein 1-domain-containing protein n=1 Tax=Halteromyces radiatus TaxID=101107 RepID=UPI00221EB099|nr:NMDA receptor-regulated protein 1-domain-containing protein [Halteromyces radiatus]KAI8093113.1 NMDA receptor-regulated protein 1-domain-containing protein [Halteromyces radiatus]